MKFKSSLIQSLVFLSFAISHFAPAQDFMSEQEMLEVFSGATVTGVLTSGYSNLRWTQVYEEFQEGKIEGRIRGEAEGNTYESKWFIRDGKWCENWGTGNGCYSLERIDEKTIRAYEKGIPLKNVWEIF